MHILPFLPGVFDMKNITGIMTGFELNVTWACFCNCDDAWFFAMPDYLKSFESYTSFYAQLKGLLWSSWPNSMSYNFTKVLIFLQGSQLDWLLLQGARRVITVLELFLEMLSLIVTTSNAISHKFCLTWNSFLSSQSKKGMEGFACYILSTVLAGRIWSFYPRTMIPQSWIACRK